MTPKHRSKIRSKKYCQYLSLLIYIFISIRSKVIYIIKENRSDHITYPKFISSAVLLGKLSTTPSLVPIWQQKQFHQKIWVILSVFIPHSWKMFLYQNQINFINQITHILSNHWVKVLSHLQSQVKIQVFTHQ